MVPSDEGMYPPRHSHVHASDMAQNWFWALQIFRIQGVPDAIAPIVAAEVTNRGIYDFTARYQVTVTYQRDSRTSRWQISTFLQTDDHTLDDCGTITSHNLLDRWRVHR